MLENYFHWQSSKRSSYIFYVNDHLSVGHRKNADSRKHEQPKEKPKYKQYH